MTTPHAALAAVELAWTLADDHKVTPEERAILTGFTGWGMLAPAFNPAPTGQWLEIADRLEAAVPSAALRIASDQVDTSFFTSPRVTAAVWDLLSAAGFTAGHILEPGCGAGAFMTATPATLHATWTGVEVDPTSARIATLLNPNATIRIGKLEETPLRDEFYDAAIGNVPFSDVRVSDSDGRYERLHNYFTQRALDAVRPGGYVILITSRGAIDSQTGILERLRSWEGAALVGAVRLPAGAFADAGTQAVTDIIALRKNDPSLTLPAYAGQPDFQHTPASGYGWSRVEARVTDLRHVITDRTASAPEGATVKVSRYWAENPNHVAGRMLATGFDRIPLTVESADHDADIQAAVASLASLLPAMTATSTDTGLEDVILADAEGRKEGSFHLIDGKTHRVTGGELTPVRGSKELISLIGLRDLALDLLALESDADLADHHIADTRAATRAAYDAYVTAFGNLNRGTLVEGKVDEETGIPAKSWRRPAMGGFRQDPDSALVMALEVFDQDTSEAGPAPILLGRVNRAPQAATSAASPAEALSISLGESGRVNLARIAGLLHVTESEAVAQLGDLVFCIDGTWTPASEALSGNVRRKHRRAAALAAAGDEHAERYAAALATVIPADLGPTEINVTLGSPFVEPADVREFVRTVLGARWGDVTRTPEVALWEVTDGGQDRALALQWGIPEMSPAKLVECALNNRMPEVMDKVYVGRDTRYVRNPERSAAANAKLELIRDRFSTWVWEDAERSQRIVTEYNETLNSHVARRFTGEGLTFPGMSDAMMPWVHQRAAVERITSTERALIGHPVGAGKTLSMVAGARTLRGFGLANKPMIVVPNHLLEQIAREAQQAYPTGRFLIATKDDLARDARRLFAARCATGEWDAVIITHASFAQIPVRPDIERRWIEDQKMDLRLAMTSASSNSRGAKAVARAVRGLDAKITKLRGGVADPSTIYFDQLGVDHLLVDEAHLFRRLATGSTSRDNSGMGSGESKRATDLLVKIETLAQAKPGKPVAALFTGTPWSNTLAETWVWQRYLQPDTLAEAGLLQFDAWVSAFIRYESNIEVAPDGSGFRMYRRPIGVVNAPELKVILGQVADIMDPAELNLVRPTFEVRNITVAATPRQREFVHELANRADAIRGGRARGEARDKADNMLLICNDGRAVALDPRLAGVDEDSAKLDVIAQEIAAEYHQSKDRRFGEHPIPGAFQLAFMDLGTPRSGDSQSYGRLRRLLIDRGIPQDMIRFVHEATTDKARGALFAACRDGQVAVLIASTAKAGMGTNIQTRLTHIAHVDAPWLPAEVTQREGRGIRPGNLAGHVRISRPVVEGTFDAFMWQALERKSRSFDALYASGTTAREIEDVSGATMSYGELKALASGNPLLLDQAKLRAEVKQLQTLRAMHMQGVNSTLHRAAGLRKGAEAATASAERLLTASGRITGATDRESSEADLAAAIRGAWQTAGKATASYGYGSADLPYRGISLQLQRTRDDNGRRVVLATGYRMFAELFVPLKRARRSADVLAADLLDEIDQALAGVDDERAAQLSKAGRLAAEADAMDAVAAAAVFEQQGALDAAVATLGEVDAAIAEAAAAVPAAAA